jgi:hypothetical protein
MLDTLKKDFLRLPEVLGLPLGDRDAGDATPAVETALPAADAALAPDAAGQPPADAAPAPDAAEQPPVDAASAAGDAAPPTGPVTLPPLGGGPAEQLGLF